MSKRLNDEERAELVAYLDGETSGAVQCAIEQRLSLDPVWRAEADSLKRTWDLLDFLPRSEPSPGFAQRTMSKLDPIRKPVAKPWPLGGGELAAFAAAWAAAVLLAPGGGYFGSRAVMSQGPGEAELTRDLRIIENKRLYDLLEDFDFVQELDQPDLFGEDSTGG